MSRPNVMTEADMAAGRIRMMKLSEIKDILLDPDVDLQEAPVARPVSFLLTWTSHTPQDIRQRFSEPTASNTQFGTTNWLRSTVTTHDGADARHPISFPSWTFRKAEHLLELAQQEMVYTCLEMYYDLTRNTANEWLRIPLEIRVRDIVHYRLFKDEFTKIDPEGKTSLKVRSDNVIGFSNRPENTNYPLHAFCGSCLKIGPDHQRCSGRKVCKIPLGDFGYGIY